MQCIFLVVIHFLALLIIFSRFARIARFLRVYYVCILVHDGASVRLPSGDLAVAIYTPRQVAIFCNLLNKLQIAAWRSCDKAR